MKEYQELLSILFEGVYIVDKNRKIIYWNKGSENITGFSKEEVENRNCFDNILKHVDESGKELCFNGCPLHSTLHTGIEQENNVYLHHKDGHRVPVTVRTFPIRDADSNVVAAVEVFSDNRSTESFQNENNRLRELLITDELTQVYNRRYLDFQLKKHKEEADTFGNSFGVLFFDLDLFKNVNDTYGHNIGDKMLQLVSRTISKNVRSNDIFGRWGGEEFILVTKLDNKRQLKRFAEKLRILVEKSSIEIKPQEDLRVTVSVGGTIYEKDSEISDLIEKADKNMYNAKVNGRNKSIVE